MNVLTMTPDDAALVAAAQQGNQLAFERLLRRHQRLLDAQASRFYLPGDEEDVAQEARIGFIKAVRFYRGGRGSSFRTFAELCVSRQLASALTASSRLKHHPLSESARGEEAERASAALPDRVEPLDQLVARERLSELTRLAASSPSSSARRSHTPLQAGRAARRPGGWGCRAGVRTMACSGRSESSVGGRSAGRRKCIRPTQATPAG